MRWGRAISIIAAATAAAAANADDVPGYSVELAEYRLSAADDALVAAFDAARTGETELQQLVDEEKPQAQAVVSAAAGTRTQVGTDRFAGELTAWPQGARVELELNMPRFFAGSPLLLKPCRSFPVAMAKLHSGQGTSLLVRTVRIDDGRC